MRTVKVVIVDDHPLLRKGLKDLLQDDAAIHVVAEADNGARGLELIESVSPDIAILDIDMPVMDGIDVARMLRKRDSRTALIFLTIHKDRSLIKSMSTLGVKGYVLKDSAMDEIIDCVKEVAAGRRWLSPKLESLIAPREMKGAIGSVDLALDLLTPSELRVLELIARSRTTREIAEQLHVSARTVETHRYNICSKFEIKGSHALLRFAADNRSKILNAASLSDPS